MLMLMLTVISMLVLVVFEVSFGSDIDCSLKSDLDFDLILICSRGKSTQPPFYLRAP